jgi:L-malate glycosyltransferase
MIKPQTLLALSNHGEIVGGGEISLLALLEALDRSCWSPIVVVPSEGEVASRCRALELPTRVIPMPSLRRPGPALLRSVVTLRRLARETSAGLFHANGSRAMFYAGVAGRLSQLPVIWHVRVADPDKLLDSLLTRLASAVIANSKAVGWRLSGALGDKIRCIHNGVDLARFVPHQAPPGLRASLGLPECVPVVASIGRFVPYKGYGHLLEAARLVQESGVGIHWVLVGEGELREELEQQCRTLGLEPQVHFTGWREDVPDILAVCDLFVLPSMAEHFGRVIIEAMAMGKAVVATDAGGIPEIVRSGETGLLVPPGDATALARAVSALLADPARCARLGAAGRRRVEAEFSLGRHVEAVEALYAELLHAKPRPV